MLRGLSIVATLSCAMLFAFPPVRAGEPVRLSQVAHTAILFTQQMPQIAPGLSGNKLMHVASGDVEAVQISHVVRHSHSIKDELFYIVAGRGNITIAGHVYTVNPGDLIAIPHQTPHEVRAIGGGTLRAILIAYPEDEPKDWVAP